MIQTYFLIGIIIALVGVILILCWWLYNAGKKAGVGEFKSEWMQTITQAQESIQSQQERMFNENEKIFKALRALALGKLTNEQLTELQQDPTTFTLPKDSSPVLPAQGTKKI